LPSLSGCSPGSGEPGAALLKDLLGTGSGGAYKLPPHLLVALAPLLVLFVALDAYCLIDLTAS
jgi:hypothetical protein